MVVLKNLPGAYRACGGGDGAADIRGRELGRQSQGVREQAVADEHRRGVVPLAGERRAVAPKLGAVHDVVVQQGGQVHHLDDHRSLDGGIVPAAGAIRRQAGQRGAQLLALVGQSVLRVRRDLRIERRDLTGQFLLNPVEERRHRQGDFLPFGGCLLSDGGVRKRGRLGSGC